MSTSPTKSRAVAGGLRGLLVVDASQGVEAQTLANVYHALDAGQIVPVLNKVDLPAAEPEKIRQQIEDVIGIDASDAVMISAKTGLGVARRAGSHRHPAAAAEGRPRCDAEGAIGRQLVRRLSRRRRADSRRRRHDEEGSRIRMMGTNAAYDVERVGFFTPKMTQVDELGPGEIGFITAAIKEVADTRVGDTITDDRKPITDMLPGFKPAIPVVFCACSRSTPTISRRCARRWASCG